MSLKPWRWPVAGQILGALLFGLLLGFVVANSVTSTEGQSLLRAVLGSVAQPLGRLFIRIIFMVVVPLVFAAVVLGVAEMGGARLLGRIGLKSLVVTLALTVASVAIGLGLAAKLKPGSGLPEATRQALTAQYKGEAASKLAPAKARSVADTLVDLVPQNPLSEAANAFAPTYPGGGLVGVMVFSLFVGLAIVTLPGERTAPLLGVIQGVYDVSMAIIGFAMKLAPLAVGCLGFSLTATTGLEALRSLGYYLSVCFLGFFLHQFGVYSLALRLAGGLSPKVFFLRIREAMGTAFATASSNATLPVTLRVAEGELLVPRRVSRFVLTVGSTANHCGTALYVSITVLFLAQVFGVTLDVNQYVFVSLMSLLAGVGTAGVPGGTIPLVVVTIAALGIPGESIAIVLGVDRLLDMGRTTLNVTGNLVSAVLVARGEAPDSGASAPGHSPQPSFSALPDSEPQDSSS
jgi:DAACS family dicarboxylate/amino acid:cation (Na+ or H+) symporter